MEYYEQLNELLEFIIQNEKEAPVHTYGAAKKLNVDERTVVLMCSMMYDDGLLMRPRKSDGKEIQYSAYMTKYRAHVFLKEGGYKTQYYTAKRHKTAMWFSDWFDIIIKPLTVISLLVGAIWASIKIYGHFINLT